jgi:hypothetical protein
MNGTGTPVSPERPGGRSHRFAFVFLPLLATIPFLGALLRREVFVLRDHFDYFAPLRWFTAEQLKRGTLPLWNPYSASGEPWLANPQTGVFYPPTWLFLVLRFETAYVLYLLLHVALLGIGAYLLFARKRSEGAALVGAVALMFAGPTLSLMDVSNNLTTYAWLPWVLWCALERKPVRGGIVLALAFLAGEPLFAAIFALMFVVAALRFRKGNDGTDRSDGTDGTYARRPFRRVFIRPIGPIGPIVLTALIAFGLSAVQLLPFIEMLRGSDRSHGLDITFIFRDSAPPLEWVRVAIRGAQSQQFIIVMYAGVAVSLLALIGATRWREARPWLVLLALAIVVSAGSYLAPVAWLIEHLPLTLFRYPARFIPLGMFAIVALAVIGWERIRRPKKRWVDLIVIALILVDVLPATGMLFQSAPFSPNVVPYEAQVGADAKIVRIGTLAPSRRAEWVSGYLNLYESRYDEWTAAPLTTARVYAMNRQLAAAPHPDLLAFVPAGWVITERALPAPFVKERGLVYRYPHALPLATFWSSWVPMHDGFEDFLAGRTKGNLFVNYTDVPPGPRTISAVKLEMGLNEARLDVDAPSGGVVVLAQQDAEGWSATVDGTAVETLAANGIFRSVHVEKGRHIVVWKYRPISLFIGAVMTLITLSAMSLFLFVKRSREGKFLLRSHEMRGVESPLSTTRTSEVLSKW